MSERQPETPTPPLDDTDWSAFRSEVHRSVDALIDAINHARERARWRPVPEHTRSRLLQPFAARGEGLQAAVDAALDDVLPYPTGNADPRFWGWVHGSGVPAGILGDILAAGINANNFGAEQSAAYVELAVLAWLKQLVGFPESATGLMVSGGSMANLTALAVARNQRCPGDVRSAGLHGLSARPRVYASQQTHASVHKALALLGLGESALASIAVDADYRIDLAALRAQIAQDRANGWLPLVLVANAGTVNTGAVDPLPELADLAAEQGLWLHVDGAIGVAARLCDRGRDLLRGIERADSIALDLHKWLYMPYECGAVLIRGAEQQRASFGGNPAYLARLPGGVANGPFAFNEHGLQLSRGNKALKVWLALRAHGSAPFAAAISENLAQAQYLAEQVRQQPDLELLAPVELCIVCFRYRGAAVDIEGLDRLNQQILIQLQERGIAVPSGTVLNGRFAIRVSITNHRTRGTDLDALIESVLQLAVELAPTAGSRAQA